MPQHSDDMSDQLGNSASSPRGEASTQLFLKYPFQAGSHIQEHIKLHGYSDYITHFQEFSRNTACVTVTPASVGAAIISKLNGSKVMGQYMLSVGQYRSKTKFRSRIGEPASVGAAIISKLNGSKVMGQYMLSVGQYRSKTKFRSRIGEMGKGDCPAKLSSSIGPGGCKLYIGYKLPEYTNEQHVREHFKRFKSSITDVELVRDKYTNQFKGYGFITFTDSESASEAIDALCLSNLLGVRIKVSFKESSAKKGSVTPYLPSPSIPDDEEDVSSSDCESVSSSASICAGKIKVIVNTKPKLPSSVRNSHFINHFGEFRSSIVRAFVVRDRKTRESRGFGIILFSSDKAAEYAIEKMRSTKIIGKYAIISLGIQGKKDCVQGKKDSFSSNLSESLPTSYSHLVEKPVKPTDKPATQDCVVIENMDRSFTETQICSIIKVPMLSHKRLPPPSNQVMIKCYSPDDAATAVLSLHQKTILGRCISAYVTSANHPQFGLVQPSFDRILSTQSSESEISSSVLPFQQIACRSVKITHLPQDISKEDLCVHFRSAGEIDGEPSLFPPATSGFTYAYINYFDPLSAERAVSTLHRSVINGISITVKIHNPPQKSSTSGVSDPQDHEVVKNLNPQQWNSLMIVDHATGTSMFKEVVNPFSSNPNVRIIPDNEKQSLKFTGKRDAVENACSYVMKHLNKELSIDRCRMEALYHLKRSLPEEMNRSFGVRVSEFRPDSSCIRFDGQIAGIEKAHIEVSRLVSCLHKCEVPLKQECQLVQLEQLRKNHMESGNLVFVTCPADSVSKKMVLVWSFDCNIFQYVVPEVVRVLTVSSVFLDCSAEESVYLKCFNQGCMSKLSAKVTIDGEKIVISGTKDEVDASKNYLHSNVLKGLYSKKYAFSCSLKFKSHIEQSMLRPHSEEEPSFRYLISDLSVNVRRDRSRRQSNQSKNEGKDELCVFVFSKNREFFDKVCLAFDQVRPSSKPFPINHHGAEKIVMEMKQHLENKYNVRIVENKSSSVSIQGLIPEKVLLCYDEIKERVESTLITSKYIPIDNQMYMLLKLYQAEFSELRKGCDEIVLWPQNRDHESCVIRITGTIGQVSDVQASLRSGLLSMTPYKEDCVVACPSGLFVMWCRRWNQIKEQEAKSSKTSVTFKKDSEVPDENKLNVRFLIIGTDQVSVQEVRDAILSEGVETEEKVVTLSQNGISCLLKARKEKTLGEIIKVITFIKHIDRHSNKVTLVAPKELSDYLDMAEEQVRRFVGDRANTNHVVCSKDPVVSLILSTPARSMVYTTHANAIAKPHQVSVQVQRKPSVGLRLCGTESSIEIVKPLVVSAVFEGIEMTVGQTQVHVEYIYEPFLTTPDFSRFETKLGSDLCVTCSYPKPGKVSKLICSSLVRMETSGHFLKVEVCQGDLVLERVDAIVNAANENLKHDGGLAKAICDAGGPGIQDESNDYIAEHKKLFPGTTVCLGSGDLPCKRVIHAVGPRWRGGGQNEEQLLYFSIFNSLKSASKEFLTSIAFPAIGTGIFNVPEDVCARVSLKAVRDFCQSHSDTSIQKVKFVLYNQTTVNSFKPVLESGVCGEYQASGQAFKTATLPSSSTPSSTSTWQWLNDQGLFSPYTPAISSQLASAYLSNPKGNIQVTINGMIYTIDFFTMKQVNNRTGAQRPVRNIGGVSNDTSPPDIQWRYTEGSLYVPYTPQQCLDIEKLFQDGEPGQLMINGNAYTIDPVQMCQINVVTGFKRNIDRRIGPELASPLQPKVNLVDGGEEEMYMKRKTVITLRGPHDCLHIAEERLRTKLKGSVTKKCYDKLPKGMTAELEKKLGQIVSKNVVAWSFADTTTKDGKPQRVMNLEGVFFKCQAAVNAVQEEILNFHISSSSEEEIAFPQEWQPQTKTTELFPLQHGGVEWSRVHGKFSSTMPPNQVVNISRIQNKWLWEKYVVQKKRLDRKNNGRVNEMELFHGTRSNDPKNIYEGEDGFDMRFGAQGMWGVANYFAVNASYSQSYSHTSTAGKQMFLVNVLTGDSHQCPSNSSLRMPPTKTASPAGGEVQLVQMKYDTVTGVTNGSQVFMTYDNDKAYPAYLITYN